MCKSSDLSPTAPRSQINAAELKVAVVGAGGKTGVAVARALELRGANVRRLVRAPSRALPESVVLDLLDASSVHNAVAGADVVYHLAPNVHPGEERIGRTMINACRTAGVNRLVYHSVLHPQIESMPHHWAKLRVEEAIIESDLEWAILRPAAYMQNLFASAGSPLEVPYSLDARFSFVDLDDVAAAAAEVVINSTFSYGTYELSGPKHMSVREAAAVMRRPAAEMSVDTWASRAHLGGQDRYAVESLTRMFEHYDAHGLVGNSKELAMLLKRLPRAFAEVWNQWATVATAQL